MARTENVKKHADFIWSVADLLRGDYKQADYGKVILPFTVLRRLDCVLEPTKDKVMDFYQNKLSVMKLKNPEPILNKMAGYTFHNTSKFTFQKLTEDPNHVAANLKAALQTGAVLKTAPVYRNRDEFETDLQTALDATDLKLLAPLKKAILNALSERDDSADICTDSKGNPEPDSSLRDYENVPLKEDVQTYFEREVLPHVPDAWIDERKTRIGYEISFTRYFYQYKPLRSLADIRTDILALEAETEGMIHEALDDVGNLKASFEIL